MPRVKRGPIRRRKRQRLLARTKGFFQTKSKLYRAAKEAADTALAYAYVGRRRKKRDFRRLWVIRDQRRSPRAWAELQSVHQRSQDGRCGS